MSAMLEWMKAQYNRQYELWVPWLEDLYLKYFTKDNKASYTTRGRTHLHGFNGLPLWRLYEPFLFRG
jgi:hypothetical protein